MPDLPTARSIRPQAKGEVDRVTLNYDERFLRRKRLVTDAGLAFLADLAETVSLAAGDCFELDDGRLIAVAAAAEPLFEIRGNLPRLAWHIGNRHTPCEVREELLVIRRDPVLKTMIAGLGAEISEASGPFSPEGGAYGHGRTLGHEHDHGHVHHHAAHVTEEEEDGEEPEVLR